MLVALAPFNVAPIAGDQRLLVILRPLVLLQLFAGVTIVVTVIRLNRSTGTRVMHRWLGPLAVALVAMVALSAAISDDRLVGAGGATTAFAFVATTVAAALVIRTAAEANRLIRWLVGGTTVAAIIGLVVFINGDEFWFTEPFVGDITRLGLRPRLTRPWSHANIAAMSLGPAVSVVFVAALTGRSGSPTRTMVWRQGTAFCLVVILTMALVLTYSRGGLYGALVAVAIGTVALWRWAGTRPTAAAGGFFLFCGFVGVTMLLAPGWRDRFDAEVSTGDFAATVIPPADITLERDGLPVEVTVTNDGSLRWRAAGPGHLLISARFLTDGTGDVAGEQLWPLPGDVLPDETVTLALDLDRVVPDGDYTILWDILADQEAYFLQFSGRQATSPIRVADSPLVTTETKPLVEPRINLSRPELWRIAGSAFAERPLLGVGPMQLASYTEPELANNRRFPGAHAHNLVLEALATWGLLGAVPLFALLLTSVFRVVRMVSRGQATGVLILVGLIASVIHATVEWQINEVSAALPLAMLVGIGWSRATEPIPDQGLAMSDER